MRTVEHFLRLQVCARVGFCSARFFRWAYNFLGNTWSLTITKHTPTSRYVFSVSGYCVFTVFDAFTLLYTCRRPTLQTKSRTAIILYSGVKRLSAFEHSRSFSKPYYILNDILFSKYFTCNASQDFAPRFSNFDISSTETFEFWFSIRMFRWLIGKKIKIQNRFWIALRIQETLRYETWRDILFTCKQIKSSDPATSNVIKHMMILHSPVNGYYERFIFNYSYNSIAPLFTDVRRNIFIFV